MLYIGLLLSTLQEHFYSLDDTTEERAPILQLQVWDKDYISPDDYLGQH